MVHIATTGETTLFKRGESVMTELTTHAHDGPCCVICPVSLVHIGFHPDYELIKYTRPVSNKTPDDRIV